MTATPTTVSDISRAFGAIIEAGLKERSKNVSVTFEPPSKEQLRKRFPSINVFLISIKESGARNTTGKTIAQSNANEGRHEVLKRPPAYLDLLYMITAWSDETLQELILLEEVFRLLRDYPKWSPGDLENSFLSSVAIPNHLGQITLSNVKSIELDIQTQIWQSWGQSFKPSLFYEVSAKIESARELETFKRVYRSKIVLKKKPSKEK